MMSTSDRELLELAARGAGIKVVRSRLDDPLCPDFLINGSHRNRGQIAGPWNPLENDGDALRLAVTLRLDLTFYNGFQEVHSESSRSDGLSPLIEPYGGDASAATRRAITRAAAEIGRAMQ